MDLNNAIRTCIAGRAALDEAAAQAVAARIMAGEATPTQIAALLTAMAVRGESACEIVGFVNAMTAAATPLPISPDKLVDTCGTGGDASGTFNISTAAAIVAAAAGVKVAKHGNRASSSRSGSADVLEALGVRIDVTPERTADCIVTFGLGFMFAPLYHTAMKHAGPVRRELGVRTIFNVAGPLTNPARVRRQVVGVYSADMLDTLADVLRRLGREHAWVVHGSPGIDEISISGPTRVREVRDGEIRAFEITPEALGLKPAGLDALRGGDASDNAAIIRAVLAGEPGPRRDVVIANAAAAILVSGLAENPAQGAQIAAEAIDSGHARKTLDDWIRRTSEAAA